MQKIIVLTLFFLIDKYAFVEIHLTDEQKQMLKGLHDSCVAETNVPESMIAAVNKGNFATDRALKCYMKCLMTSIGVMDEDGTMDFDAYLELLPDELREFGEKMIEKCKNIGPEGDACETAYKLNLCNYETDPAHYMLF